MIFVREIKSMNIYLEDVQIHMEANLSLKNMLEDVLKRLL